MPRPQPDQPFRIGTSFHSSSTCVQRLTADDRGPSGGHEGADLLDHMCCLQTRHSPSDPRLESLRSGSTTPVQVADAPPACRRTADRASNITATSHATAPTRLLALGRTVGVPISTTSHVLVLLGYDSRIVAAVLEDDHDSSDRPHATEHVEACACGTRRKSHTGGF